MEGGYEKQRTVMKVKRNIVWKDSIPKCSIVLYGFELTKGHKLRKSTVDALKSWYSQYYNYVLHFSCNSNLCHQFYSTYDHEFLLFRQCKAINYMYYVNVGTTQQHDSGNMCVPLSLFLIRCLQRWNHIVDPCMLRPQSFHIITLPSSF